MKIVTANTPIKDLERIDILKDDYTKGKEGIYPSRSELVRVAVNRLILKFLDEINQYKKPKIEEPFDDENFVRVPVHKLNINEASEYRTYKILRKLLWVN